MTQLNILGFSGSLRKASFNRGLLRAALELAPDDVQIEVFDLLDIPIYNGDVEAEGKPESVQRLQERIVAADAVLIATPEYNGSYSGVLKNAIDWASRPFPQPVLAEKPVGIMGAAAGRFGTARAQIALRQLLTGQGSFVLPRPSLELAAAGHSFDLEGNLHDEAIRERVAGFIEVLAVWARRLRSD